MDLADNDLLDLLLRRKEPEGELDRPDVRRSAGDAAHADGAHRRILGIETCKEHRMKLADNKATLSFSNGSPSVELPVYQGTIGPDVIDIRKLYAQTGMFTYDPGFMSTASCQSAITYIDGDKGELLYRGYPIEQLATNCDFLETCHLLLYGELPNADAEEGLHQRA